MTWMENYPLGDVLRIAAGDPDVFKRGQREALRELERRGVTVDGGAQMQLDIDDAEGDDG